MAEALGYIGFGEAGMTFARALRERGRAYDRKTDNPATAFSKQDDYATTGTTGCLDLAAALDGVDAVLSLVTADQALAAAEAAAPFLASGALFFDLNSVAPQTKCAAAATVEGPGGRYVDVAVLSPVQPAAAAVPLLLSGPHAEEGAQRLRKAGFTRVSTIPGAVGRASSVKMIRSIMIKGMEALTAECVIAAARAGVLEEVLASLDGASPPPSWERRADYNLDRMMVHGLRRAAEMEEVFRTLEALGTGAEMTRGTIAVQRGIGRCGLADPPAGLAAKLLALDPENAPT